MTSQFVHLRVHSEFSLYDSTVRVKKLVAAAEQQGMPAVALTDQMNMFALVKFYKAAEGVAATFAKPSLPEKNMGVNAMIL